jgi:hypothetical protein
VARRHEAQLTYLVLRLPSATSPVAAAPVERTAPAVPRFSGWASPPSADTTISVDTYLDTDDLRVVRTALAAVDEFVLELGYSPVSNVDIQLGSVFRRAKVSVRKTLKSEELRNRLIKAERALELKVLDVQQAEVDLKQADAVSRLIGSLQAVPQACPAGRVDPAGEVHGR